MLAEIDQIEQSFVANIERGEQALEAAENDYQRLEVRDAARAAQVITAALGRRKLVRRFSVLVQRAERAIAQANPPVTPHDKGVMGNDVKNNRESDTLRVFRNQRVESGLTESTIKNMRVAHAHISDDEFEELANADTDEPMTRSQLIELGREKRASELLEEPRRTPSPREKQRALTGVALDVALDLEQASHNITRLTIEVIDSLRPDQQEELRNIVTQLTSRLHQLQDKLGRTVESTGVVVAGELFPR